MAQFRRVAALSARARSWVLSEFGAPRIDSPVIGTTIGNVAEGLPSSQGPQISDPVSDLPPRFSALTVGSPIPTPLMPSHRDVAQFLSEKFFPGSGDDSEFVYSSKPEWDMTQLQRPSSMYVAAGDGEPNTPPRNRQAEVQAIKQGNSSDPVTVRFHATTGRDDKKLARNTIRYAEGTGTLRPVVGKTGLVSRLAPSANYLEASERRRCAKVILAAEPCERLYDAAMACEYPPVVFLVRPGKLKVGRLPGGTTVLSSKSQFERRLGLGSNTWMAKSLGFDTRRGEHAFINAEKPMRQSSALQMGPTLRSGYVGKVESFRARAHDRDFDVPDSVGVQLRPSDAISTKTSGASWLNSEVALNLKGGEEGSLLPNITLVRKELQSVRTVPWREVNARILRNFFPGTSILYFLSNADLAVRDGYRDVISGWLRSTYSRWTDSAVVQGLKEVTALALLRDTSEPGVQKAIDAARQMRVVRRDGAHGLLVLGVNIPQTDCERMAREGVIAVSVGGKPVEAWGLRFLAECIKARFTDMPTEVIYYDPSATTKMNDAGWRQHHVV